MSPLGFGAFLSPLLLFCVSPHLRTGVSRSFSSFLKPQKLQRFVSREYPRRRCLPSLHLTSRCFSTRLSSRKMAVKVLVPVAHDSEEIEAVSIIDTLRRAGAEVVVASVEDTELVRMSRGVCVKADKLISAVENETYDCIAIPGGMPGAERCRDSAALTAMLKTHKAQGKLIAAICASPAVVLQTHGLLQGEKAVAYPCFMDQFPADMRGEGRVCVSNKIVTSVGPSSAIEFALKLIEVLYNKEQAKKIAAQLLYAY
ncbi:DJ-1 family protein [Toxoplasma gondii TgCatPRC2]|uniref:DJ-1 family protein n=2 Tax=Toxoplasma gondii TaxID=5811 RepID=A0A151HF29_TOXGO|nr:DJ-1 family protein [Toxoplasma gondii RUB]KYK67924.1 DJ-1 family protein [Toxoplasma gondii TgCatPRC2]